MNQFSDLYSKYYDLIYQDKDYQSEVAYVDGLIKIYQSNAKTLLDMGCGTGKHAEIFCDKGYIVHGVDLSTDMLAIAETRRIGKENKLSFSYSNIQDLALNQKFDIVVSLFHVMSYQNSNQELIKAFQVAKEHLIDNGIFIFDFWYAPAVLTDLPTTRVKRLENEWIKVTRLAEPVIHAQENIVDVNYDVFVQDKKTLDVVEKKELHKMRYLFDTELELICEQLGFKILNRFKWMSHDVPSLDSWNVVWVLSQ
ncbi:class I SAM-dependent methyltransferase [Acinetobacter sp. VNH17]|uniref:Class I SAM-dependent methyltransferase n=1 Tax=Acinetobacter thutiue TaxID=2998078 RepID=A0ABT7WPB0_9GAMM|nr:class I SAM-dependent methyltransferase [Acinetobacter thutiue]MCY6412410.1 class I SAM-dependent methyltransferase [Acinetobacter thutiue]MDN0014515.1 class I SAM-dependent methyltransferase [Acinetobacter thutiue]